jgi:hypothetical protein
MLSFTRSLAIRVQLGDRIDIVDALESIGLFLVDAGTHRPAARILAAAAAARAGIELPPSPARASRVEAATARLREVLGESDLRSEWAQGGRLGLDDAIALAAAVTIAPGIRGG